jgi:hypothetical protein
MKWTRKTIENTIIIALAVVTAGALAYVPLSSYLPFKENQDQIISAAIERDNKTLKGIEANLKEGVKVYDNGLATLDENDFDVYAVYGGKYADALKILLEPDQYSISIPNDFSVNGGLVSISYMGKVIEMNIPLQKMELVDLKIIENPYKVTYEKGENFEDVSLYVQYDYNDEIYVISASYGEINLPNEKDENGQRPEDIQKEYEKNLAELQASFEEYLNSMQISST